MHRIALLVIGLALSVNCAAGLDDYKNLTLPASPARTAGQHTLSVTFIGVATLLFDDGETAIMTDGFFSRPDYGDVARGRIEPIPGRITTALQRAGVKSLAAVIPLHSHFDHAMDAPAVAMQTGAMLVGSESTANVGRGVAFPESRIHVPAIGETMKFGRFNVSFIRSAHFPTGYATGAIDEPLSPPAKATNYKEGECYTLLIEHGGHTILVQGSAGYVPGELTGRHADVAYLGIGGLDGRDAAYRDSYWREIVAASGARRVIPIHWDNFFRSLELPLTPAEGFDQSMSFITARAKQDGVDVRLPALLVAADPFAGL